jgi:AcrR family transcriptional regulator
VPVADPGERTARSARLPRSARRRQLLGAAQEVFVAQGYHAAAMDDIADRAGVSKPVLYQHFPWKLDLYLALLEEHAEAMVAAVREALDSTSDNKQRVAATIEAYFRFVDEDGGAFRLVFESDLTNQPEVRERVEGTTLACAELISEVIREDAGLPKEQSRLLAVGLVGMAQVSARYWLAEGGSIPRDAASRLLASLSWRGIGGFPLLEQ